MKSDSRISSIDNYFEAVFSREILSIERCDDQCSRIYNLSFPNGATILVYWNSLPSSDFGPLAGTVAQMEDCIATVHVSDVAVDDALGGRRARSALLMGETGEHAWTASANFGAIIALARDASLCERHLEAARRIRTPGEASDAGVSSSAATPISTEVVIDVLSDAEFANDVTSCRHLDAGRTHDVFAVDVDERQYVVQRVNESILNADDLAAMTDAVFSVVAKSKRVHEWPASGQRVYRAKSGAWIVRDMIEGDALTAPIDADTAMQMAAGLRQFHQAMHQPDIKGTALRGIDPWADTLDSAVLEVVEQPRRLRSPDELATLATMERARIDLTRDTLTPMDFGIVHRDPKPSNFLRTPSEQLTLVDYDTIGYGAYIDDLGELIRSIVAMDDDRCCGAIMSSQDVAELMGAVVNGYRAEFANEEAVRQAARRAALRLAQRFLLDHIRGNVYFSKSMPGENLRLAVHNLRIVDALSVDNKACDRDDVRMLVYLAAPNRSRGQLGEIARRRLERFAELASSMTDARLVLTGGYGSHYNCAPEPHYCYAFDHLIRTAPTVADRIEACLPTRHSFHDVMMSTWYAEATNSSSVTLVTSHYHCDRIRLLVDLIRRGSSTSFSIDDGHSTNGLSRQSLSELGMHDAKALRATALTAVLFGTDDRIW